jgi:hypothetical protein
MHYNFIGEVAAVARRFTSGYCMSSEEYVMNVRQQTLIMVNWLVHRLFNVSLTSKHDLHLLFDWTGRRA